jgi:hypothetical protein
MYASRSRRSCDAWIGPDRTSVASVLIRIHQADPPISSDRFRQLHIFLRFLEDFEKPLFIDEHTTTTANKRRFKPVEFYVKKKMP